MIESRWSDAAAAYVLGALEPDEIGAFEERLAADAELRAEVDAFREVVAALADEVPRHAPPETLRSRILEEARASRPIGSAPSAAREPGDAPDAGSDGNPRRSAIAPWLAAAAALIAAVALGVVANRAEQRRADLEARLGALETELEDTAARLADRDSLLATFLGPDVRAATLSRTDQQPSARLFWNTATSTLLVAAFDLPPAPAGRVYQLWGIAGGDAPVSLGTFQTAADGTALVQTTAPVGATFDLGAVTEEPAGGSPQPTSAPFLVGSWTGA